MSILIDSDEIKRQWNTYGSLDIMDRILADVFPTVDAVPVVRCGECRHRYLEHDVWICRFGLMIPSPDGFCSYGEKVTE